MEMTKCYVSDQWVSLPKLRSFVKWLLGVSNHDVSETVKVNLNKVLRVIGEKTFLTFILSFLEGISRLCFQLIMIRLYLQLWVELIRNQLRFCLFPRQLDLRCSMKRRQFDQSLSTQQQLYQLKVFSNAEQI